MSWRLSTVDPASTLAVSVDEVKEQTRLMLPGETDPFDGAENALIERQIRSAIDELDSPQGWLGRSLVTRDLRLSLDGQPTYMVRIPCPPIQEILSATYIDSEGAVQPIDLTDFMTDLDADEAYIWPKLGKSWPVAAIMPGRIKIDYRAGYGTASAVPAVIRDYLLIMAATKYRDRESTVVGTITSELQHVRRMLNSWRVW